MLGNSDVISFTKKLPLSEQQILSALSAQEDWPLDDTEEIQSLLERLSSRLQDENGKQNFLSMQPHMLSALMANLNMARYSIIMKEVGNKHGALAKVLDEDVCLNEEDKINRFTIYIRASYMVQYGLLQRIYSKERFDEVLKILLAESEQDDNEKVSDEGGNDESK